MSRCGDRTSRADRRISADVTDERLHDCRDPRGFVVPDLSDEQRAQLSTGALAVRDVQSMAKDWIAVHVEFSADAVPADVAAAAEAEARRHGLPGVPGPTFNPLA